jgi:hypothetical protein
MLATTTSCGWLGAAANRSGCKRAGASNAVDALRDLPVLAKLCANRTFTCAERRRICERTTPGARNPKTGRWREAGTLEHPIRGASTASLSPDGSTKAPPWQIESRRFSGCSRTGTVIAIHRYSSPRRTLAQGSRRCRDRSTRTTASMRPDWRCARTVHSRA